MMECVSDRVALESACGRTHFAVTQARFYTNLQSREEHTEMLVDDLAGAGLGNVQTINFTTGFLGINSTATGSPFNFNPPQTLVGGANENFHIQ